MVKMEFNLKRLLSAFGNQKSRILLFLGVSGILLIFLSSLPEREKTASDNISETPSSSAYTDDLSSRLEDFISSIEGAGEAKVLITLENSGEDRYLKAENIDRVVGSDSEKAARSEEYVLTDGEDGKTAVLVSSFEPEIRGVAVVCEGGDDAAVRARITDAVAILFHISSARVSVSKMVT